MSYTILDYVKKVSDDAENNSAEYVGIGLNRLKELDVVDWAIKVFSKVPLVWISEDEIAVDLRETLNQPLNVPVTWYNTTDNITTRDVKQIIELFGNYTWSKLVKGNQVGSRINSAVPLFLYAHKKYNDIMYSQFYSSLERMPPAFLGCLFSDLNFNLQHNFSKEQLLDLRKKMYTKNNGEQVSSLEYYTNYTQCAKFDELPVVYKKMITQTWIFSPKYRNENMINNWKDWDILLPTALVEEEEYLNPHSYSGIKYNDFKLS